MSAVKLKNAKQLEKFLRILAEESVGYAMNDMAMKPSEPARQKDIVKRMQRDKSALTEEDPENTPPETSATEPAQAEKPAAKTPSDTQVGEIKPTLDAIIRAIKEIRSGFGSDDSAIEQELSNYFDRLDEAERISMIVFMRSVGDIMRREATGAAAPEPGQYNVVTSMKPGEEQGEKAATPAPAASEPAASSPPPASGQEDTTPPIKIGEPMSEAYRRKIRDLLRRN
jgi:hypothetical protein